MKKPIEKYKKCKHPYMICTGTNGQGLDYFECAICHAPSEEVRKDKEDRLKPEIN